MKINKLLTLFFILSTMHVFAADAKVQTILLWPETPPGAMAGDAEKALATAASIKAATYKVAKGNRGESHRIYAVRFAVRCPLPPEAQTVRPPHNPC